MLVNGLTQPYKNIFHQDLSYHQRSGLHSNCVWGFSLACKAVTTLSFCSENCPFMSYKHVMSKAIKIKFKASVFCSVFPYDLT